MPQPDNIALRPIMSWKLHTAILIIMYGFYTYLWIDSFITARRKSRLEGFSSVYVHQSYRPILYILPSVYLISWHTL